MNIYKDCRYYFYYYSQVIVKNLFLVSFLGIAFFHLVYREDYEYMLPEIGFAFFFFFGLYLGFVYAIYSVKYLQKKHENRSKENKEE